MTNLFPKIKTIVAAFLFASLGTAQCVEVGESEEALHLAKQCLNYVLWNAQIPTFIDAGIEVERDRDSIESALLVQAKSTRSVTVCHQFVSGELSSEMFYRSMWRLAEDGDNGAAKVLWNHGKFTHITNMESEEFGRLSMMAEACSCTPAQYQTCYAVACADILMSAKREKFMEMAERGNDIAQALTKSSDAVIVRFPSSDRLLATDDSELLRPWKQTSSVAVSDRMAIEMIPTMITECVADAIKGSRKARERLFSAKFSHSGKEYSKGLMELHMSAKNRLDDLEKVTWALAGWLDICMIAAGANNL